MEIPAFIKAIALFFHGLVGFAMYWTEIDKTVFFVLGILLLIDFLTGVLKAHALGQHVRSNKMKYGVVSKLLILLIPIIFALCVKALGYDLHTVLIVSMNILVLSEVYSIIGNIYCVRTGKEIPEYDALSAMAKVIRKRLERLGD